jgi:glycosyltransferase involved in cell wall biosynthesis
VVVPIFNEAENLAELHARLSAALEATRRPYELILVDDGSTDGSPALLDDLHAKDPRVRVLRLARNFGQHAALSAGMERARGAILVTLDADLQNDPADIPKLLAKMDEGYDVVSGCRTGRGEGFLLRRLPSRLGNATIRRITGTRLHDYNCSLKALRAEVAAQLPGLGEMRRFLGALVIMVGRRVAEVPVAWHPRRRGLTKYTALDLISNYLDFLTTFSRRPFQVIGALGLALAGLGLLGGLAYFPVRFGLGVPLGVRTQLVLFLAVFLGFQFAILGLLGEFTTRIYRLVQHRPFFVVKEFLE